MLHHDTCSVLVIEHRISWQTYTQHTLHEIFIYMRYAYEHLFFLLHIICCVFSDKFSPGIFSWKIIGNMAIVQIWPWNWQVQHWNFWENVDRFWLPFQHPLKILLVIWAQDATETRSFMCIENHKLMFRFKCIQFERNSTNGNRNNNQYLYKVQHEY